MEINSAASILVIINSVLLALFLILLIIATIFVLKLVKSVKRIAIKAEEVVDSAEAVTEAFKNVSGPMGALKLIKNIMEMVSETKKGKK
jgi:Na+-transporting methylmalonyl-CoA/oxaloacetate decarboxylase gamma subunit